MFIYLSTIIFGVLLYIFIRNYKQIKFILKVLPRDIRFIYRYISVILQTKNWKNHNETVCSLFEKCVKKHPDRICFRFEDESWTYNDVNKYSDKVAQIFWKAGFRSKDCVCLFMLNRVEYVCIWLGLAKIGVITSLINYNIRKESLKHCINVVNSKAIIFDEKLTGAIEEINECLQGLRLFVFGDSKNADSKYINLSSMISETPSSRLECGFTPGNRDCLMYIYTSGTTGLPKAAVILHTKFLLVSSAVRNICYVKDKDIIYNCLPLYHMAGGVVGMGQSLIFGITSAMRSKFSASNYWKDCVKYDCTVAQYIGEICRYLIVQSTKPEEKNHRIRMMLGNGLNANVYEEIMKRFNIPQIVEVYAATEGNSAIVNFTNTKGSAGFLPLLLPKKLSPLVIIKTDEENNPIRNSKGFCIRCNNNEPGMLITLMGKINTMREFVGYLNKNENSKKTLTDVFKEGDKYFITGDIFVMDDYGNMFFKDRTGDTFRWKGENVSTTEIETYILKMINNRPCAVYGVPVPGNEGRAGMLTIAQDGEEIDINRLGTDIENILPSYSRPIFLRITTKIELTGTFKMKKTNLLKEGYNPTITKDPIYYRDRGAWKVVTEDLYKDFQNGRISL